MATSKGKDLTAFKKQYDKKAINRAKVQAALKTLGNRWEYESEFVRACKMASHELAGLRDEFADHTLRVNSTRGNTRIIWCGTAKLAAQCREVMT